MKIIYGSNELFSLLYFSGLEVGITFITCITATLIATMEPATFLLTIGLAPMPQVFMCKIISMQNAWYFSTCMQLQSRLPPVDLYLISEKSIWKNQVRRTGFLVYFQPIFYCPCSLQKSKNPVCRTWVFNLNFQNSSADQQGVRSAISLTSFILMWYFLFSFIEKSDVSKIWQGQKAGEDANETKVH